MKKYPYFRASNWCNTRESLHFLFVDFVQKHIPCCIAVWEDTGQKRYSVWRTGKEATERGIDSNCEEFTYQTVADWVFFEKIGGRYDGTGENRRIRGRVQGDPEHPSP